MTSMLRNSFLLLFASATGLTGCAAAQTLTRPDPAGDYHLEFKDLDNTQRSMTLEATDLISPTISVSVAQSGGSWTYTYTLSNSNTGKARTGRGVWLWKAACGSRGSSVTPTAPTPWRPQARDLGNSKICEFQLPTSAPLLDPGMSASGFSIASSALPMVGLVRVFGSADVPNWPVETDRIAPRVLAVADSVAGLSYWDHSGAEVYTLLPLRNPDSVTSGAGATALLKGDLATACAQLGWITNQGVCKSLDAKLNAAQASFTHGQADAGKQQLLAFLNELSAQRDKGVSQNAFDLLSSLVAFTLSHF